MAINPGIILQGQQPSLIRSPFDTAQRQFKMADLMRAEQANQQAAAEQQAVQQVLRKGLSPEETYAELQRVSPGAASTYQQKIYTQQKQQADLSKTQADTSKIDQELAHKGLEMLGGHAQNIMQLPPEQRQQAWQAGVMQIGKLGLPIGSLPFKVPDDSQLQAISQLGTSAAKQRELAMQKQGVDLRSQEETRLGAAASQPKKVSEYVDEQGRQVAVMQLPDGTLKPEILGATGMSAAQSAEVSARQAGQAETARHNKASEQAQRAGGANGEPLVAVMKDGKPTYVPRSQAVGMQPASGREQGRAVVSGDANKIADFDTSLNDLKTLRETIPTGATGTAAKVGAMLPNAVTDLTGWGTEAKQKQAVIDRVKQVIGKTLEGGVLRKEDEYKYEKILPTIADTSAVAKTKMDGLERAIQQRRQTTLDALDDAGYDVSQYRARSATQPKPAASSVSGGGWKVISVK